MTLYAIYGLCLVLVFAYAHERFATPEDYRFTTRRGPYWWSYSGYVAWTLFIFLALCFVLTLPSVRQLLIDPAIEKKIETDSDLSKLMALPVPLAAALAVSVLLPKLPVLQRWDNGVLAWIRDKANIPGEVVQLARRLEPQLLTLTAPQVTTLRRFVENDDRAPAGLADHLRDSRGDGYEQSQFRFTRVLCLYAHLKMLSRLPRYARFFQARDDRFQKIEAEFWAFAVRSDALLTLAREVQGFEARPEFAKVLAERRQVYRQECEAAFKPLAELTAYALLSGEASDSAVEARLRDIGFAPDVEVPARERFPINELTLVAVGLLLLFLVLGGPLAGLVLPQLGPHSNPEAMGVFIVAVHTLVVVATVRLVQSTNILRTSPNGIPPVFACLCWALVCATVCWGLAAGFISLTGIGPTLPVMVSPPDAAAIPPAPPITPGMLPVLPIAALNGVLAFALAVLCGGALDRRVPGAWKRPVEAMSTALAMSFAGWLIAWAQGRLPTAPGALTPYVMGIGLPGVVGGLMGGFVPEIVRVTRGIVPPPFRPAVEPAAFAGATPRTAP